MKRLRTYIYYFSIVILLLVSQSAFWLHNTIFDTDTFTELTAEIISEESSRESIGDLVVSTALESRPKVKAVAGDALSGAVADILGTDLAQSLISTAAQRAQLLVTSPEREPVVLELGAVKSAITQVQEFRNIPEEERQIQVDDIPDQVVLIDTKDLPNVHETAVIVFWLGPLSLLLAIALITAWIIRGGRTNRIKRIQISGLLVAISGLVALVVGPLAEPAVISIGRDAPTQTLLRNIYEGFIAPFNNQAIILLSVSLVVVVVVRVAYEVNSRYMLKLQVERKKTSKPKK